MHPGAATLPRTRRLLKPHDFRAVYRRGRRARGPNLVVVALPRRGDDCRLGVSVSKQHGNAVRRNRIKRTFREAFRLERATFGRAFDLIMIPQPRERYELEAVRRELVQLVAQVAQAKPRRRKRR